VRLAETLLNAHKCKYWGSAQSFEFPGATDHVYLLSKSSSEKNETLTSISLNISLKASEEMFSVN
jgi:hypothetical protein